MGLSEDEKKAVLGEFLSETREHLALLEQSIVASEGRALEPGEMQALFRHVHTLKGSCGWLGFSNLEQLTHVVEALLDGLRAERGGMTTDIASLMLRFVDVCRQSLVAIEVRGEEGDPGIMVALAQEFERAKPGSLAKAPSAATVQAFEDEASHEQTIRVDLSVLDTLMNQVSELVLARNQILQAGIGQQHPTLAVAVQRLNLVTSELQEGVMKTRMQPIQTVWSKVPRLVRDLSIDLSRLVKVELEGSETELDRTLVEAIRSPIMHLVRNCVDHGIEPPNERVQAGKEPEGRLILRAFHEGGYVNIEVIDDGRGIDTERVRLIAIERNLISVDDARAMSAQQAMEMIFLPGFSTAQQVTHVSGRGVGMDVVRANVEAIGGNIELHSTLGAGTTVRIKIPLTLAIVPALIVVAGGDRFAIAQASLIELVRLDSAMVDENVESVHDSLVYRLRGQLVPLVSLSRLLKLSDLPTGSYIVIVQAENKTFGIVVDDVRDTEEIVVKPLGRELKHIGVYAGATIMGDGVVALILDVVGLARRANVMTGERRRGVSSDKSAQAPLAVKAAQRSLLFLSKEGGRYAVALEAVSRLEELEAERIERLGDRQVVQYRGGILPLVTIEHLLEERRAQPRSVPSDEEQAPITQVIVLSQRDITVGVVVHQIIDILEHEQAAVSSRPRHGVLGTTVLLGKVTEVLDVDYLFSDPSRLPEQLVSA